MIQEIETLLFEVYMLKIQVLYVSDLKKENEHRRLMQLVFDCGKEKSESVVDPVTPFSEAPPTPNQLVSLSISGSL